MLLQQRNRPDQQVITSPQQIDIKQTVIPDQTINPFVVGHRIPWPELYHNLHIWIPSYRALGVVELKNIATICEKLILSVELRIIGDCQDFSACVV